MKIFDAKGNELYDLPDKPRNFDGWAHDDAYGLVVGDEKLKLGKAANFDEACYRLKQMRRAYVDGAETFTVKEF